MKLHLILWRFIQYFPARHLSTSRSLVIGSVTRERSIWPLHSTPIEWDYRTFFSSGSFSLKFHLSDTDYTSAIPKSNWRCWSKASSWCIKSQSSRTQSLLLATSSELSVTDTNHIRSSLESTDCYWSTVFCRNIVHEWGLTRMFLLQVILSFYYHRTDNHRSELGRRFVWYY